MKLLGSFIKKRFKGSIANQVKASSACIEFDKMISESFGSDFAKNVRALHFRNGVLTIDVNGSAYAQEIHYKAHVMMKELNDILGSKDEVKRIAFRT